MKRWPSASRSRPPSPRQPSVTRMPAGKIAVGWNCTASMLPSAAHAGLERERGADALADDRVGRDAVEAAGAAGGDGGGLGDVGDKLAGDQVAHDRAVAAAARRGSAPALPSARAPESSAAMARSLTRTASRGRCRRRRSRSRHFLVPPKSRCATQAVRFVALGDRHLLAVDDDLAVALAHAAPRHAPGRELAHRLRRRVRRTCGPRAGRRPSRCRARCPRSGRPRCRPAPLITLPRLACMPPWAAAECERLRGTSDRMSASCPRRLAPIADAAGRRGRRR